MPDRFNSLFEQLLAGLQSAEKRHRAAYGSASDSNEWDAADRESAIALRITNWRRALDALHIEIADSDAVSDDDINNIALSFCPEPGDELSQSADLPSQADDERIGRYVWQKMRDLSASGHNFSECELSDLQDVDWSRQVLNLPCQFFLQTTDEVRYYWKRDTFIFNDMEFRLSMLWYNDQYRGRSQRECFDRWYDSLSAETTAVLDDGDRSDDKTNDDIKVGKHIRGKLRELSRRGFAFSTEQILEMCNIEWSLKTFAYSRILPFAKILASTSDISEQTKDEKGYSRYWHEVFTFSEYKLLIISQWYVKDKDSFDKWYDKLTFTPTDAVTQSGAQTIYEPQQPENVIGTKPAKLKLLGKQYVVNAWNDLYLKVCEILLLHCPYVMATLDKDTEFNSERRTNFSYIQSEVKYNRKRLSNGLWVETNKNSADIMNTCHRLLEKCGFSPEELQVETVEGHI